MYEEILATFLIPYMAEHFNIREGILHQENDPKPEKSPDLNIIEMLWHSMLEFIILMQYSLSYIEMFCHVGYQKMGIKNSYEFI